MSGLRRRPPSTGSVTGSRGSATWTGGGLPDLAFGAPDADLPGPDAGSVYVFFGETVAGGGTFAAGDADVILRGEAAYDQSGSYLDAAGDIDGDGLADLLVGSRWSDDPHLDGGRAYVWFGSSLAAGGTRSLGEADRIVTSAGPNNRLGGSVAGAGDVDGDGLADVLVGAFGDATGGEFAGAVWLFRGSTLMAAPAGLLSPLLADAVFYGQEPGDSLGHYLCQGGDLNDDGLDDLVLGAWGADATGPDSGRTYVVFSPF